MKDTAVQFGNTLDQDQFELTEKLLSPDCVYIIGNEKLNGPQEICHSYESNMIEGRKKLDVLEWAQSQIEQINPSEYYAHFTDYLTHKEQKYTHRCMQKLSINADGLIYRIEHIHDDEEQKRLDDYYRRVGLK